jgi:hypothetical protein
MGFRTTSRWDASFFFRDLGGIWQRQKHNHPETSIWGAAYGLLASLFLFLFPLLSLAVNFGFQLGGAANQDGH